MAQIETFTIIIGTGLFGKKKYIVSYDAEEGNNAVLVQKSNKKVLSNKVDEKTKNVLAYLKVLFSETDK